MITTRDLAFTVINLMPAVLQDRFLSWRHDGGTLSHRQIKALKDLSLLERDDYDSLVVTPLGSAVLHYLRGSVK